MISAPSRCFAGTADDGKPLWGVFLPLYALRTARSWGAGDFSDLETLAEWTAGLGGGVVATLPLLAAFLDEPFEPSPYAPASPPVLERALPRSRAGCRRWRTAPAARRLIESPDFQREVEALRAAPLVDYARLMALKRRVLEELAQRFFARPADRLAEFERFVAGKPGLEPTPPSAPWATAAASPGRAGPSGCARGRSPPPTTTRRTGATTSGRSGPPTSS